MSESRTRTLTPEYASSWGTAPDAESAWTIASTPLAASFAFTRLASVEELYIPIWTSSMPVTLVTCLVEHMFDKLLPAWHFPYNPASTISRLRSSM